MKPHFVIYFFFAFLSQDLLAQNTCRLSGKVSDRPKSDSIIYIIDPFSPCPAKDLVKNAVKIKIKDGLFEYDMEYEKGKAYVLLSGNDMSKGYYTDNFTFFPVKDGVNLELFGYEDDFSNKFIGGKENELFNRYRKEVNEVFEKRFAPLYHLQDSLFDNGLFLTDTMETVYDMIRSAKDMTEKQGYFELRNMLRKKGLDKTEMAKAFVREFHSLQDLKRKETYRFISENPSIPSLYLLVKELNMAKQRKDIDGEIMFGQLLETFEGLYSEHPYVTLGYEILETIKVDLGGDYFDFTLSDTFGNKRTLSEEIEGKFALLNIWAPWCGPCIVKSRKLIPIYEEFKDSGFTIVGVASKYIHLKNVGKTLEKEGYPWNTMIDKPENKSHMNASYGTLYSGGGTFLIDKDGKIVAIDPSIEEIKAFLEREVTKGN